MGIVKVLDVSEDDTPAAEKNNRYLWEGLFPSKAYAEKAADEFVQRLPQVRA